MTYRTIVADPPWPFAWARSPGRRRNGSERGLQYPSMGLEEIAGLGEWVRSLASHRAALFLWVPDSLLLRGEAVKVVAAWGFTAPRLLVWEKVGFGLGTFPRPQHEVVVVARRGAPEWLRNDVGSVHRWNRPYSSGQQTGRIHSAKPDAFLDLVEQVSPGPRLELFARRQRLGWDTWGNEALEHVSLAAGHDVP